MTTQSCIYNHTRAIVPAGTLSAWEDPADPAPYGTVEVPGFCWSSVCYADWFSRYPFADKYFRSGDGDEKILLEDGTEPTDLDCYSVKLHDKVIFPFFYHVREHSDAEMGSFFDWIVDFTSEYLGFIASSRKTRIDWDAFPSGDEPVTGAKYPTSRVLADWEWGRWSGPDVRVWGQLRVDVNNLLSEELFLLLNLWRYPQEYIELPKRIANMWRRLRTHGAANAVHPLLFQDVGGSRMYSGHNVFADVINEANYDVVIPNFSVGRLAKLMRVPKKKVWSVDPTCEYLNDLLRKGFGYDPEQRNVSEDTHYRLYRTILEHQVGAPPDDEDAIEFARDMWRINGGEKGPLVHGRAARHDPIEDEEWVEEEPVDFGDDDV